MLAHGGPAGAVGEILFVVVPIVVFALLSRRARLKREREDADAGAGAGDDAEPVAP